MIGQSCSHRHHHADHHATDGGAVRDGQLEGRSDLPLKRRGAVYVTAAVGLNPNPNTTTADFAVGPSLSWRLLMISPLYHFGRDLRLTQGEHVGQTWAGTGTPPAPSTQRFWSGAFAIGISVRVPTSFGSNATK